MTTEQDFSKQMASFIKEAGLEEEYRKLEEMFTDNLLIKGEETQELKEALHRAPDTLIDIIWTKVTGQEPDEELSRQQKEESLYEDIPEYFKERLGLMDIADINLLIQVMAYKPIGEMEAAKVMTEFVPLGWVFAFLYEGGIFYTVMNETKDILMTLKTPKMQEKIATMNSIRYTIKACLGLYGVCPLKQLQDIILKFTGGQQKEGEGEDEGRNFVKILEEYLPYLEKEKELWLDGEYVVSPYLKTKKDYKILLRKQKRDYYFPDDEVIMNYGRGKMLIENEEYHAVFKLLNRELKDTALTEKILEEMSAYVIREDWELRDFTEYLLDWNVTFGSEKTAEKMFLALSKWLNVIRRWSECGHCRGEFLTHADYDEPEKEPVKKIYPNDPCPCGSGKKYKKCCGRK